MAFSFYIDPEYKDFRVSGNTLVLANGSDAIRQQIQVAITTQFGEWFLDTTQGIPYYYSETLNDNSNPGVLGGNYSAAEIGAIIRKVILETPGVVSIESFELSENNNTRALGVNSKVVVEQSDVSGIGTQSVAIVEVSI